MWTGEHPPQKKESVASQDDLTSQLTRLPIWLQENRNSPQSIADWWTDQGFWWYVVESPAPKISPQKITDPSKESTSTTVTNAKKS